MKGGVILRKGIQFPDPGGFLPPLQLSGLPALTANTQLRGVTLFWFSFLSAGEGVIYLNSTGGITAYPSYDFDDLQYKFQNNPLVQGTDSEER